MSDSSLEKAIKEIVEAESQIQKKKAIGRLSIMFYTLCRQEGLEREDIINITTQILDCFISDLDYLKKKVKKQRNSKPEQPEE